MKSSPNTTTPLVTVLKKLAASAVRPFDQAQPIPASVNHSREFLEREQQNIFMQEWICIGRDDEIPNHGDYLTHDISGVPILVVRQEDGDIRAFVNACAHRFACLMPKQKGSARRFTCRYHAWTYDCRGQLIRAPHMEMKLGFEPSQYHLRKLILEIWEGFIFVSLSEQPATCLSTVLEPLCEQVVGQFDMGCYRTVLRESMIWNANWKNLIENFTESYHVPMVHGKTFAQHNKPLEDYICGEDSDYYCYHRAAQPEESGPGAAHKNNTRLTGEWRRMMVDFCVFPSHLVTLMPDYLWYVSVQPIGTDQMHATWGVAVPPEVLDEMPSNIYQSWLDQLKSYMDAANTEDKELVEALFRGTQSPLLPPGTYHPLERNLWQFTRYLSRMCQ